MVDGYFLTTAENCCCSAGNHATAMLKAMFMIKEIMNSTATLRQSRTSRVDSWCFFSGETINQLQKKDSVILHGDSSSPLGFKPALQFNGLIPSFLTSSVAINSRV